MFVTIFVSLDFNSALLRAAILRRQNSENEFLEVAKFSRNFEQR